jgi:hypothetical protein
VTAPVGRAMLLETSSPPPSQPNDCVARFSLQNKVEMV